MAAQALQHELEAARRALGEGDLLHAVHHLGGAFGLAPMDEQVDALFEELARKGDLLTLVPDEPFFGNALVRAAALRRAGRLDEAVVLVAQCAEQLPDRGLETLLALWLEVLGAHGKSLSEESSDQVTRLLSIVGEVHIGINRLWPGERALLAGFGDLAAAFFKVSATQLGRCAAAGMLRRVGRYDEGLALPIPAEGNEREIALIHHGLLLRAKGEPLRALERFEQVHAEHPENHALVLEQARCCFVAGEFDRARDLLQSVLEAGDAENTAAARLIDARPEGDRLRLLDENRRAIAAPPLGTPSDATANVFREQAGKFVAGKASLRMAVAGWEAPSNRLLASLYASASTNVTLANYSLALQIEFDPLSQRRGPGPLWVQRDGAVVQAVAPPSIELRTALLRVGLPDDGFGPLWSRAAALGERLDPALAPDLAAAMVHPLPTPEFLQALPAALYRHQVATACVLANLPGWEQTRPVFEGLIFGPYDWVGGAAISALGERAKRDEAHAAEIRAVLCSVAGDLAPHSCDRRYHPLLQALHTLPGLPLEVRNRLEEWGKETGEGLEEDAAPDEQGDPPPADEPVEPAAKSEPQPDPAPEARGESLWQLIAALLLAAFLSGLLR